MPKVGINHKESMTIMATQTKFSQQQRLEFIDFRLFWSAQVNRKDLTSQFGISAPQASADLKFYQEQAPRNIEYNSTSKAYEAGGDFEPFFYKPDSADPLRDLEKRSDWLGWRPQLLKAELPERKLQPRMVRAIVLAMKSGQPVEVLYQSISRPESLWRVITPEGLVSDGARWHVRAFCHRDLVHKDFVLSRVLEIRRAPTDESVPPTDLQWEQTVKFQIIPHPQLGQGAKRALELEHQMSNGVLEMEVPMCLAFYLERRLCLDEALDNASPERRQLVLANRDEVHLQIQRSRSRQ